MDLRSVPSEQRLGKFLTKTVQFQLGPCQMTNFEILNGGGRRRGTRVHVFINYIIKLNKTNNRNLGCRWRGGGETAYIVS